MLKVSSHNPLDNFLRGVLLNKTNFHFNLAVGGVQASSPFVPQQTTTTHIVTTVLPIGNHPTHMICPRFVIKNLPIELKMVSQLNHLQSNTIHYDETIEYCVFS